MIPTWAAAYVGLPFLDQGRNREGVDCFGLVRLVLAEQFSVELPSYTERYASATERDEVAALLLVGVDESGWYPVSAMRAGDGLVLRIRDQPWHVGLVLDAEHFLHILDDGGLSRIERIDHWVPRILGVYRHRRAVATRCVACMRCCSAR